MTDTAAAHNLEHGPDVIKVTTPATAALSARSDALLDLAFNPAERCLLAAAGHRFAHRQSGGCPICEGTTK